MRTRPSTNAPGYRVTYFCSAGVQVLQVLIVTGYGVKIREFGMAEKIKVEMTSRREVFSVLGLTAALCFVVLTASDAEAQTPTPTPAPTTTPAPTGGTLGMQRRHARRVGRHERREARRTARHERREKRRGGGEVTQPKQ
jgi:hypothetical protein